ncbi:TPR-like protein [Gonapodya prolifera JEL478]|uniref:TPR-like protein n=1 Tax=Gonapodya prolifera (strain JEL478) TaxID=1344416 RepID=A0A139A2W9_GONPJ|nr:TPR-like protein [Gonapodya prolifera JEL478]|eukprot:KXS10855.1 TPR-like protein [Gonapodya prolifera JEL478]
MTVSQRLTSMNEQTWLSIGTLAETMNDADRAMAAYESALRHNPYSVPALTQIAALCRAREQYPRAVEYFNRVLAVDQGNGEVWGALGHCYLMQDDLQKAYQAYQQALYHLPNPKEPKLWYGIGILYDRYGSYDHAEEAFAAVIRMEPKFEKANEIYFRLGIIYKQQGKYELSLQCFRYILGNPPKPLTEMDIWFQIGHVHEQQKDFDSARTAYERVLAENPTHAKVLQQLGWLYHQQSSSFANQELAVSFLSRSLESDPADAQTWYLLGRCFMAQQKFNKAYDAYQQAVYRDGRNPTFWCSIGVLYYQINQYRDALDAYSRAIRLNPYISEVWYDLGTLYESCNNQISDAMDAYKRALELDPNNPHVKQRLQLLEQGAHSGAPPPAGPQDRSNPMAYNQSVHPSGPQGPQVQAWGPPQQMPGYPRVNGAGPGSNVS